MLKMSAKVSIARIAWPPSAMFDYAKVTFSRAFWFCGVGNIFAFHILNGQNSDIIVRFCGLSDFQYLKNHQKVCFRLTRCNGTTLVLENKINKQANLGYEMYQPYIIVEIKHGCSSLRFIPSMVPIYQYSQ